MENHLNQPPNPNKQPDEQTYEPSGTLPPLPYIEPEPSVNDQDLERVAPIEYEEQRPALAGLRRFIYARKTERQQKKLLELHESDHVIRSAPSGASRVRGFRSNPELNDVVPVKLTERIASQIRQSQAERSRKQQLRLKKLQSSYSSKTPVDVDRISEAIPEGSSQIFTSRVAERSYKNKQALRKKDGNTTSWLGTPEHTREVANSRMRPRQRRAIKKDTRTNHSLQRKIARIEKRMQKGEEGSTSMGRLRAARINRVERNFRTNQEKVDSLDRTLVPHVRQMSYKKLSEHMAKEEEWSKEIVLRVNDYDSKIDILREQISTTDELEDKIALKSELDKIIQEKIKLQSIIVPDITNSLRNSGRKLIRSSDERIRDSQEKLGALWSEEIERDKNRMQKIDKLSKSFRKGKTHRERFKTREGRDQIRSENNGKLAQED